MNARQTIFASAESYGAGDGAPHSSYRGALGMSCLGRLGRFGNSVFQYIFGKTYAHKHRLEFQSPEWVGNTVFEARDPPVAPNLHNVCEYARPGYNNRSIIGEKVPLRDVDLQGYFMYHTSYYSPYREYIQRLCQAAHSFQTLLQPALNRLDELGDTRVGIHLRRGDFGSGMFYITPVHWYLELLEQLWPRLHNPVLFVATDDPSLTTVFRRYAPETVGSLGVEQSRDDLISHRCQLSTDQTTNSTALDFFPDWYLLSQCDVLAVPQSSFSFTAAMMNRRLQLLMRSTLKYQCFIQVDPWDAWPYDWDESLDLYHDIPGTRKVKALWAPTADGLTAEAGDERPLASRRSNLAPTMDADALLTCPLALAHDRISPLSEPICRTVALYRRHVYDKHNNIPINRRIMPDATVTRVASDDRGQRVTIYLKLGRLPSGAIEVSDATFDCSASPPCHALASLFTQWCCHNTLDQLCRSEFYTLAKSFGTEEDINSDNAAPIRILADEIDRLRSESNSMLPGEVRVAVEAVRSNH
jgi:hypothetical protein